MPSSESKNIAHGIQAGFSPTAPKRRGDGAASEQLALFGPVREFKSFARSGKYDSVIADHTTAP